MPFTKLKEHKTFEGKTIFAEHESSATKTTMKFSAFLPQDIANIDSAIIWLSGLTCNEENFITKSGVQKFLAKSSTMIICPDTSPRGLNILGENDSYDFGSGAGFYVNATKGDYRLNYQMYDYIKEDLVELLKNDFGVSRMSIVGHSMGGHGALVLGLRNNDIFESISAFSPIVNPINCSWGEKAFTGYLGEDKELWKEYDACELIKSGKRSKNELLVEQGTSDEFWKDQLKTSHLEEVCLKYGQKIQINLREGYDHSYYFISTFIERHTKFHLSFISS